MAKPYRRRKGKGGKFVGAYRINIGGRDVNLGTKDASEAHLRARLAEQGKWPPVDAAAAAAAEALDPTGDPVPEPPEVAPAPAVAPPPIAAPRAAELPSEPLHVAAAAAAADVGGEQREAAAAAVSVDQQSRVDVLMSGLTSKLGSQMGGGDVMGGVCHTLAAYVLMVEKKVIEWGGGQLLARRKIEGRLELGEPDPMMHTALAIGLQAYAVQHLPDLQLTPGWAVAIGLVGGGFSMGVGARIVALPPKNGVSTPGAPPNGAHSAEAVSPPPA